MRPCFEELGLLCDIKRCKNLHGVADEAVDTDAEHNECHEAIDRLEVEDKNAVAVLFVCEVGDHSEDQEEGKYRHDC